MTKKKPVPEHHEFMNLARDLEEYAGLEHAEYGEYCMHLISISTYSYTMSETFAIALYDEMKEQLDWYKSNTDIVQEEETFKQVVTKLRYHE